MVAIASLPFLAGSLIAMLFQSARRRAVVGAYLFSTILLVSLTILLCLLYSASRESSVDVRPSSAASASVALQPEMGGEGPASPTFTGKPGRVRVCLTEKSMLSRKVREVVLPASTVFEDGGALVGDPADYRTWRFGLDGGRANRSVVLVDAVKLGAASQCAEAGARVLTASTAGPNIATATERRLYAINDVLYYPVPPTRPTIEIAKLIDDSSVKAAVIEDIEGTQRRPSSTESKPQLLAKCRAEAQLLSLYMKARLGRQTDDVVFIEKFAPEEVTYNCRRNPTVGPHVYVSWRDKARPSREILDLIAVAGEHLLGVPRDEMLREVEACVATSIKSRFELADRDFRGAKISCQARPPEGVWGSVDLYRRFGRAGSLEN